MHTCILYIYNNNLILNYVGGSNNIAAHVGQTRQDDCRRQEKSQNAIYVYIDTRIIE